MARQISKGFMRGFNGLIAKLILAVGFLMLNMHPLVVSAQNTLTPSANMLLDSNALLMPSGSRFGRSINGRARQSRPLITFGGYQFATWYHNGDNDEQDIYISRRDLSDTSNTWHTFDTGYDMSNGDEDGDGGASQNGKWDSHNVIGMGISGDGRIHLAYDHHVDTLRYLTTRGVNKATLSSQGWANAAADPAGTFFVPGGERAKFNAQDSGTVNGITYPRFASQANGDLIAEYRTGGSGNGDTNFLSYNSGNSTNSNGVLNQRWGSSHEVIDGTSSSAGTYSDAYDTSNSNRRNAYLNGIDSDSTGKLHMTWTWRESTQGANHDIMYAYSEDGGDTWRNNVGAVVADEGAGLTINLNSPGIKVVDLDRTNSLMNQQGQTVDQDGGVHTLMWHRRFDEAGFEWEDGEVFDKSDSAYYHYYRDPLTGQWDCNQLPTIESVGSRPQIGYDANGDLFAVYTSANDLIVAGATSNASFQDWEILYSGTQNFASDPILDQTRLLNDGVLSIFLQESGATSDVATGSSLRVLEFDVSSVPEPSHFLLITFIGLTAASRRRKTQI
ncbi:MAG: BNR repeat-containing protein [Mariniblastus sp.]